MVRFLSQLAFSWTPCQQGLLVFACLKLVAWCVTMILTVFQVQNGICQVELHICMWMACVWKMCASVVLNCINFTKGCMGFPQFIHTTLN